MFLSTFLQGKMEQKQSWKKANLVYISTKTQEY